MFNGSLGWFLLLAQEQKAEPGGGGLGILPVIVASAIAMYLIMIRPERKREKDLQLRLEGLKKNDRVVTAGGIYGTVVNVRREADEVTLKIDEDNNTKMRVTLRSIIRVVEDTSQESKT